MSEPSSAEIKAAASEAVEGFVRRLGTDLSTGKFVIIAESIDEEGERGLWFATGDQQTAWDSLGLLQYAMNAEEGDEDDG